MWKALIEIACLIACLLFLCSMGFILYVRIRYVVSELGLPSEEFKNGSRIMRTIWSGIAAIVALIGLEDH
jgi:hypothetical protein